MESLNRLKEKGQFREIPNIEAKSDGKIVLDGKEYINFASNDYLGISTKRGLAEEFLASGFYPLSSASARLLTGSSPEFTELEKTTAEIFSKERALIFNTGYQCNLGVISALIDKGDVVFSDKLNHASIIDGMRLAKGDFYRYKHLDYDNLERMLEAKRENYKRAVIVSESVFSMDGDTADIERLIELKNKYNCLLMLDEAHAFCCWGKGLAGLSDKNTDVDIITATFGKAVGSFGAFCASSSDIISYLINTARSFIFSTSIPPLNIAWSNWLLTEKRDYILSRKKKLEAVASEAHIALKNAGFNTVSSTHIIPIVIGSNEDALKIAERLKAEGFYIPAIRPPTVPEGTSRLRISLTADSKLEDFNRVLAILKDFNCRH